MGFWSSVGSGLKKVAGGVKGTADYLSGNGDKTSTSTVDVAPASQQEQDIFNSLLDFSKNQSGNVGDPQLEATFKNLLTNYLAKSYGDVTPDILKQATDYVDQTFTNPAQSSFDQFQRQYTANANEQSANLGRQPTDSSIQQQNFRTLADLSSQLGAERGSKIAQRSDLLSYERPMQQDLSRLSVGSQGIGFINDLNQRAFQNRLGLMNLQSGLYGNLVNQRFQAAGRTNTNQGPDLGLLGNATKGIESIKGFVSQFGGGPSLPSGAGGAESGAVFDSSGPFQMGRGGRAF